MPCAVCAHVYPQREIEKKGWRVQGGTLITRKRLHTSFLRAAAVKRRLTFVATCVEACVPQCS